MPLGKTRRVRLIVLTVICLLLVPLVDSEDGAKLLNRKKRYVVFPEGSSFSIALCMTVHTLTPDNIFTEGLNWGISYDLPNESKPELAPLLQLRKDAIKAQKAEYERQKFGQTALTDGPNRVDATAQPWIGGDSGYYLLPGGKKYYKASQHYLQRRYRRDLYDKMERIISAMGFDGRSCILRALCEAAQRFMPKGNTLIEEMIRIVFSLPLSKVLSFEPKEHRTYADAHRAGHEQRDCLDAFPGCSFSLVDMALGRYNAHRPTDSFLDPVGPPDIRYVMK